MATSGTGAIITEGEAYYYGHIYLSTSSVKALTYGKMVDNANVYHTDGTTTTRYFAGAWITDAMRSTKNVTPPAINRYKCVKYTDIWNKSIRVPWYVRITEKLWPMTSKAHTIELRYYYKTSSTATERYVSCNAWDNLGNNVDGTAYATHYFEANPRLLYNGTVYSSRLVIWCGNTGSNETWRWRLRTRTGPTSGTWGPWTKQSQNAINSFAYPSGNFLYAMKNYNGVEFEID